MKKWRSEEGRRVTTEIRINGIAARYVNALFLRVEEGRGGGGGSFVFNLFSLCFGMDSFILPYALCHKCSVYIFQRGDYLENNPCDRSYFLFSAVHCLAASVCLRFLLVLGRDLKIFHQISHQDLHRRGVEAGDAK